MPSLREQVIVHKTPPAGCLPILPPSTPLDVVTLRNYSSPMEFQWNESKRKVNLRKHGIDFIDVPEIFSGPLLTRLDTREDYKEDRWIGIGYVKTRVLVVCYVERTQNDVIRIISARKALNHERKYFEKKIANRLE
jgi:uncharacterized DUF497 family protein